MMDRDEMIKAATVALIESLDGGYDEDEREAIRAIWSEYRKEKRAATDVVNAVEPLIRADERLVEDVRRDLAEDRAARLEERLLSIYKNVEHTRNMLVKYIDSQRDVPGSFIAVDVGRREALNDVLALFETEAYQKRVGSDE